MGLFDGFLGLKKKDENELADDSALAAERVKAEGHARKLWAQNEAKRLAKERYSKKGSSTGGGLLGWAVNMGDRYNNDFTKEDNELLSGRRRKGRRRGGGDVSYSGFGGVTY